MVRTPHYSKKVVIAALRAKRRRSAASFVSAGPVVFYGGASFGCAERTSARARRSSMLEGGVAVRLRCARPYYGERTHPRWQVTIRDPTRPPAGSPNPYQLCCLARFRVPSGFGVGTGPHPFSMPLAINFPGTTAAVVRQVPSVRHLCLCNRRQERRRRCRDRAPSRAGP